MDYVGYLDVTNSDDYQFVYASQLYGTFFCIYAHFNADKDKTLPTCDEGQIPISNISFQIVNYKGAVNIGITDVNHISLAESLSSSITNGMGLEFKIELQAMNGSIEYPYNHNFCINHGDQIMVKRVLKTLNPATAHANAIPLQNLNEVFDTEEWERNGLVLPINRTEKHEKQPGIMAPGRSCIDALFYVK